MLRLLGILPITLLISCNSEVSQNPQVRSLMYEHEKLTETVHMLEWLHSEPIGEIRRIFSDYIEEMVGGSQMVSLSVASDPQWLTGGKPQADDESKIILTRTGVAFLFSLNVKPPAAPEETVTGVFSWVGVRLDDPPNTKQRTWIDVGGTLEDFGSEGELQVRIYALEAEDQASH